MRLSEFEAKGILQKYGIAIPQGNIASNPDEAEVIAKEIGKPVVLKSQIAVSSRGKSGGIIFADDTAEAKELPVYEALRLGDRFFVGRSVFMAGLILPHSWQEAAELA